MPERGYFGTDGIRDTANRGLLATEKLLAIGGAIGASLTARRADAGRRPRVLVVRDTRVSGPMIAGIIEGALLSHGVDVVDGGELPTPGCALLTRLGGFDLGIVISASHNPMPDNGVKLFGPNGRKVADAIEKEIEHLIDNPIGSALTGTAIGRLTRDDGAENRYIDAFTGEFFATLDLTGMRIVVDCANGAASRTAPRTLSALGALVTAVNHRPDGLNINDGAGVFHAGLVAPMVVREEADLGIVLDGDGDRVVLVDEKGTVRDGDDLLAVLMDALPDGAPRSVVTTVMSNMGLMAAARRRGVVVHQTAVGDRYVAEKMASTGSVIGGEQSGHVIFHARDGWFGDGVYTALKVIELMRQGGRPLSALATGMERFPQVLVNVPVKSKPPLDEVPAVRVAENEYQRALGDEGRILVRYSGTEMLCRVMVEGRDRRRIEDIASGLSAIIGKEIGGS